MNKLGSGYGFTKIDLADAYNQINLGLISRKRLALSTHRGALLQNVLPFGISSAPGYFQSIMEDILRDLTGVAVYLDQGWPTYLRLGSTGKFLVNSRSTGNKVTSRKCHKMQ